MSNSLVIGGAIYSMMEDMTRPEKSNYRWLAVCPSKGDGKIYARTRESLVKKLEDASGGIAEKPIASKQIMWASDNCFNGKPIIQWYANGLMDVDTPRARFRLEMGPNKDPAKIPFVPVLGSTEDYDEFNHTLLDTNGSGAISGRLTKIRLKTASGETLRDIDVDVHESSDYVSPPDLINTYVVDILENGDSPLLDVLVSTLSHDGNRMIDMLPDYENGSTVENRHFEELEMILILSESLKFLDENLDGEESSVHYHNPFIEEYDINFETVKNLIKFLVPVLTRMGNIQ